MSKEIIKELLPILNKAQSNKDRDCIEMDLNALKEKYPESISIGLCKDEEANNSFLVTVFDYFTRFFIISQNGSSQSFYVSPTRLNSMATDINSYLDKRGTVCSYCSNKIVEKIYRHTSLKLDPKTNKPIEISDARHWHCDKCGHDFMSQDQENHLTDALNKILTP